MLQQMLPEVTFSLVLFTFLEGIFAFLSPCILPLLPVYLIYLGGRGQQITTSKRLFFNSLGFITGFTVIFVLLGATASSLSSLIIDHRVFWQRISGLVMIGFGLGYLDLVKLPTIRLIASFELGNTDLNYLSSMLFGAAFAFSWTPCLSAFLGSALLLAANSSTVYQGSALLFVFALGLGIPFLLTAVLWQRLQGVLTFLKRNQQAIRWFSGGMLIVVGLLMVFQLFGYYVNIFL